MIKQNEPEIGNDVLLVSEVYFIHVNVIDKTTQKNISESIDSLTQKCVTSQKTSSESESFCL